MRVRVRVRAAVDVCVIVFGRAGGAAQVSAFGGGLGKFIFIRGHRVFIEYDYCYWH